MTPLDFLKLLRESSPLMSAIYQNGSCGQLYFILKELYPQATAYDDLDHIITEIDGKFYDITGEVCKKNHLPRTDAEMREHYTQLKCGLFELLDAMKIEMEKPQIPKIQKLTGEQKRIANLEREVSALKSFINKFVSDSKSLSNKYNELFGNQAKAS